MPAVSASPAEAKLVLAAAWQPQMIFSVVWFGLAILAGIRGVLSNRDDLLLESLICGSLGIGFFAWFRGFKLELNDSHLVYRAPLVSKKAIAVSRIQRVLAQRIVFGSKLKSFGYQNIVVESKDRDSASLVINARVFPEEAAKTLLNELGKRGVSVTLT
jgi:hypothetical protein